MHNKNDRNKEIHMHVYTYMYTHAHKHNIQNITLHMQITKSSCNGYSYL